ncbi:hypothetical protein Rsub_06144 [Raphidocelis subcapitata]|uniref:Tudor domain-containing protein n=1 Tax=Raphidocelis subcapitata TaxID=307507 RepID=A0A2V0P4H4_9CHLO|nr:hypothetical protein Rsub_06144 [Raphidocelis subcapitata]|eukprot:GBF93812.1 hypothetical protein Rsub_06144 [Raphidocelis subcapitata]
MARVRVWIVREDGGEAEAADGRVTAACQLASRMSCRASAHAIDLASTRWEPLGGGADGGKGQGAQPDGVGRVRVWWSYSRKFYEGLITDLYPAPGDGMLSRHRIEYDDGDVELINMQKKKWHLAPHEASAVAAAAAQRELHGGAEAAPPALKLPPPPPADCAVPLALMHHRPHAGGGKSAGGGSGSAPRQGAQMSTPASPARETSSPSAGSGGGASPEVVICKEGADCETAPSRRKRGRPARAAQAQPGTSGSTTPPAAAADGPTSKRARSEPKPADESRPPSSGQGSGRGSGAGDAVGSGGGGGKETTMNFELAAKTFQSDGRLTLPASFMREAFPALQLHLQRLPLAVAARLECGDGDGEGGDSTYTAEGVATVRLSGTCRSYELMGCRQLVEQIGPTWVVAICAGGGSSALELRLQRRSLQKPTQAGSSAKVAAGSSAKAAADAAAAARAAPAAAMATTGGSSPLNALDILAECAQHEGVDAGAATPTRRLAAAAGSAAATVAEGTKVEVAVPQRAEGGKGAASARSGGLAVSGCATLARPTPDELDWLSQLADGALPAEELSSGDGFKLLAATAGSAAAPRRLLLLVQLGAGAEHSSVAVRLAGSSLVLSYTCCCGSGGGSGGGGGGGGGRSAVLLRRELLVVLPREALSGARPAARALLDASGRLAVLVAPEAS